MDEDIIQNAKEFIGELFSGNSDGHDAGHSLRVFENALAIAADHPCCDKTVTALAALLHDADDHKLFDTENNANARGFLTRQGIGAETADRICGIINSVSFSRNKDSAPESIEGKIVQDADRLDAIGAVGIARTFAYGGKNGRTLENTVGHFREKLLLLRDCMNTEEARLIAEKRHEFMESFLAELEAENVPLCAKKTIR